MTLTRRQVLGGLLPAAALVTAGEPLFAQEKLGNLDWNYDLVIGGGSAGLYLLASTVVGIVALAIAFERFSFYRRIPVLLAALFLMIAVVNMLPSTLMSTVGLVAFAALMGWEWLRRPERARLGRSIG